MKELDVAIEAAQSAGEVLRQEYQKNHTAQHKTDNTLVSEADFAAEKVIIDVIKHNFPDHAIFSEEAGLASKKSDYLWIIDPIDGSTNFLKHLAHFCTAIAIVKKNEPIAAAVYLPLTDELFAAERGEKATLNNKTIEVSDTKQLDQALFAWGRGKKNLDRHVEGYKQLTQRVRSVRLLGSAIINECYTACGRFDAYAYSDCKLYDAIAGAIIAEAAGAKVTDFAGQAWQPNLADPTSASDILISNPHIHSDLVAALKNL